MTTTTSAATETLAAAEAKRSALRDRLEGARAQLTDLRADITKTRDAHRDQLALADLGTASAPDRSKLTALQAQEPELEDRVVGLERAVTEAGREWRLAKAATLDEQAAQARAEAATRQERIHVLQAEIATRQREINEHGDWIRNAGPVRAQQLEAEAGRLRRQ